MQILQLSLEPVNDPPICLEPLSARECEVLHALGASNREISRHLNITENTVKQHVYTIFGKLNGCNRTQAVLKAKGLNLNIHTHNNQEGGTWV